VDEPTGNLHKQTAADIIHLFKKLAHQDNKCIVVVTHSQQLAQSADAVVSLSDGKFVTE